MRVDQSSCDVESCSAPLGEGRCEQSFNQDTMAAPSLNRSRFAPCRRSMLSLATRTPAERCQPLVPPTYATPCECDALDRVRRSPEGCELLERAGHV